MSSLAEHAPAPAAETFLRACAVPTPDNGLAALDNALGAVLLALLRRVIRLPGDGADTEILSRIEADLIQHALPNVYRAWSPVIAVLRGQVADGDRKGATAQFLLLYNSISGASCDHQITLSRGTLLYHRGHTIRFPAGTRLEFSSLCAAGEGAADQLAGLAAAVPRAKRDRLAARARSADLRPLNWTTADTKFVVPTAEASDDGIDVEIIWPPADGHGMAPATIAAACCALDDAYRAIAAVSAHHAVWVARLIRGFAITDMPPGVTIDSGSYFSRPGLVHCAFPLDPGLVAETLIHEASHQHFILLNSMFAMVRKGPQELIYSPIKLMERPLPRVLFAFHACINIHLFFAAIAPDRASAFERERRDLMHEYALAMSRSLRKSQQLTEAGHQFIRLLDAAL